MDNINFNPTISKDNNTEPYNGVFILSYIFIFLQVITGHLLSFAALTGVIESKVINLWHYFCVSSHTQVFIHIHTSSYCCQNSVMDRTVVLI